MQTAAMRTRSFSKSGNNNNSKVADIINPHSGAQTRLRVIAADKLDNTARSAAENARRQGRPRATIIRQEVNHLGGKLFNLFNNIYITSTGCTPSITSSSNTSFQSSYNNNVGINPSEIVEQQPEDSRLNIPSLSHPHQHSQMSSPPSSFPTLSEHPIIVPANTNQSTSFSIGSPLLQYPAIYPQPSPSPPIPPSSSGVPGYSSSHHHQLHHHQFHHHHLIVAHHQPSCVQLRDRIQVQIAVLSTEYVLIQ